MQVHVSGSAKLVAFELFDHMQVNLTKEFLALTLGGTPMATVVIVFRPPKCSAAAFFQDFDSLCEDLNVRNNVLMLGDFSFYMDGPPNGNAKRLTALLESLDLFHRVRSAAHQDGHILDLLI